MGRHWLEVDKLRSKIKRKVDTKASKGTRLLPGTGGCFEGCFEGCFTHQRRRVSDTPGSPLPRPKAPVSHAPQTGELYDPR